MLAQSRFTPPTELLHFGVVDGDMHDAYSFIATSICLEFVCLILIFERTHIYIYRYRYIYIYVYAVVSCKTRLVRSFFISFLLVLIRFV